MFIYKDTSELDNIVNEVFSKFIYVKHQDSGIVYSATLDSKTGNYTLTDLISDANFLLVTAGQLGKYYMAVLGDYASDWRRNDLIHARALGKYTKFEILEAIDRKVMELRTWRE